MLSNLGFKVELITYDSPKNTLKSKISKKIKLINCFKSNTFPIIERIVDDGRNYVKLLQSYNVDQINITKIKKILYLKS